MVGLPPPKPKNDYENDKYLFLYHLFYFSFTKTLLFLKKNLYNIKYYNFYL